MTRVLTVLLLFAILMAVANPTLDDFRQYIASEVKAQVSTEPTLEESIATWVAGNVATLSVQRRDYVVASIYLLRFDGKIYPWIGVFKNFFPLSPRS